MAAQDEDFVTVANVREVLQKATAATAQDDLIQSYITRASVRIMEYTGREFKTLFGTGTGSNPTTYNGTGARTFTYRGGKVFNLPKRVDLRSITSIAFDTDGSSPANTALTANDYRLVVDTADRVFSAGAESFVYTQIEFRGWEPASGTSDVSWQPGRQFAVTGVYGWPSVPKDVQQACIDTVIHWLRHKSDFYSAAFNDALDVNNAEGRSLFPFSAVTTLDSYRKRGA